MISSDREDPANSHHPAGDQGHPLPLGVRHCPMDIQPSDLIEEIIEPLIMGQLAERFPTIAIERVLPNQLRVDFGLPDKVFSVTVEQVRL